MATIWLVLGILSHLSVAGSPIANILQSKQIFNGGHMAISIKGSQGTFLVDPCNSYFIDSPLDARFSLTGPSTENYYTQLLVYNNFFHTDRFHLHQTIYLFDR